MTEVHPGCYIFYDRQNAQNTSCEWEDVAISVVSRVVSVYPERETPVLVLDAGDLALSKDSCPGVGGYGRIVGYPHLSIIKIMQESAIVQSDDPISHPIPWDQLKIGTLVRIIPNHSCLTAACHPVYHVVRHFANDQENNNVPVIARWIPTRGW